MDRTVDEARATLRRTRPAEAVFLIFAVYLASALPIPPTGGRALYLAAHWYGMIVVTSILLWALRQPTRRTWLGAAGSSAYFLLSAALGWRPFAEAAGGRPAPAVALSVLLLAIPVLAQAAVAAACWRSRQLVARVRPTSDAPVA